MPRASGRLLQAGDDIEPVAISKAQIDDSKGRGLFFDSSKTSRDTFGDAYGVTPPFHGPRESGQERLVVVDEQQGHVRLGGVVQRLLHLNSPATGSGRRNCNA